MYSSIILQGAGGGMSNFIMIPLMLLVIYLFMIRPQMKKQKNERQFQSGIEKGAKVVTTSGIHGKIVELQDKTCVIETSAGKIKFERSAISMELSKQFLTQQAIQKK